MKWPVGRWRLCRPVARVQPASCRRICITAVRKWLLTPVCRQRLKLSVSRLRMWMKCCCLDLSTAWPRPWIGWPAKPMGACRMVLLALAVIFLPMLLSREDESQRVQVDAPEMPAALQAPEVELQPVVVPEPQLLPDEPIGADAEQSMESGEPVVAEQPAAPVTPVTPAAEPEPVVVAPSKLDANSLPISWSVQLASLSSSDGAQKLQKTLRSQGYNAYIRSVDGMNRVF